MVSRQTMAMPLEVNAFARRVGGDEDADRSVLRVELEGRFNSLPVCRVLRAIQQLQPVTFFKPTSGQLIVKPLFGCRGIP